MMMAKTLQTVDPRYQSWLILVGLLAKLDVIRIGQTIHRLSAMINLMESHKPKPKPHWIPIAAASLSLEYIEVIPLSRRDNAT